MGKEDRFKKPRRRGNPEGKVKFEVTGTMMIEKKVKLSGNSGRVYIPLGWVDHHVKIIRID